MDLHTYLKTHRGIRQELARRLGVSPNYLWQVSVGNQKRKPSVKLAKRINAETLGAVSLESLRADVWGGVDLNNDNARNERTRERKSK